jgi:hypothetical protein
MRYCANNSRMDAKGQTTEIMERLIASAQTDREAEDMLRRLMKRWAESLPASYLVQVGAILLQSHLDEQRVNAGLN